MTEISKANNRPEHVSVGMGIDFGTSNSTAAIYDGEKLTLVNLEDNNPIMPSASYIDRDFVTSTGQEAIDTYIARNQGRKVEMSLEVLGEARTSTGQMDMSSQLPGEPDTQLVYGQAFNDGSLPGRLFRGTKRLLGSVDTQRIMVFDRAFRLVALITPILLRIRQSFDLFVQTMPVPIAEVNRACIGHPVNFEGRDTGHNNVAMERLSEAYRHAGITQQTFYPEPTAAAMSYLHANPEEQSDVILTVDFGGGTLDLCILKRNEKFFDVVAIHGIGLGGDHIDQCMFRHILFPLLGKGERWRREVEGKTIETLFPFDAYQDLLINWTVSYILNQNEYTTPVIDKIQQGGECALKFERLYELITQNYSYQVFQAIKDCKAELSVKEVCVLDIPEIDVEVEINRTDFENMIAGLLTRFEGAVDDTLKKAGMEKNDIQLVLRTGGSCLIPAVRNILEQHFPGKVVEHDPFTSVAAGLALADYYNYGTALE
ncbi:MAG: putative chaperone protein [Pseudohongiellaceae bacterium]|jgi:hypothetical chaperone protein